MAKTFVYKFGTDTITFTTEDNPRTYTSSAGTALGSGYAITGVSGTINGQTITGLLPSNNTATDPQSGNANFVDNTGGSRAYDNVLWTDNNPGDTPTGSSTYGFAGTMATNSGNATSYFGLDRYGVALTTATTNYQLYKTSASATQINYRASGPGQANSTNTGTNSNFDPAATGTNPECFLTGTLIRTARGEVAVEDLLIGDRVATASGAMRPITWIGSRTLGGGRPLRHDDQPVRIRADAFGPGLPTRDLRLSAGHPVLVGADENGEGGVLVPAMCLINGTSIVREPVTSVTYWHVELDAHDILLAEGLPAESYFEMGTRAWFSGADGMLANPDLVPAGAHGRCRPVAIDGAAVEAERLRLDAVFAAELTAQSDWGAADGLWLAA